MNEELLRHGSSPCPLLRPITAAVLSSRFLLNTRTGAPQKTPVPNPSIQDKTSLQSLFSRFPLVSDTLKRSTKRAYSRALDNFLAENPSLSLSFHDPDLVLSDYIQECYSMDPRPGRRHEMANLICALCILYPNQRNYFGFARRYVRGWRANVPSRSSVPLTRDLMLAFSARLFQLNQIESAVALAVSWSGYLRASEVLSLTWDKVALPGDVRVAHLGCSSAGVNIVNAKTGPLQFVPIHDITVVRLLQIFASRRAGTFSCTPLFRVSYRSYLQLLQGAASFLGLPDGSITTHSARIGGALHDYATGRSAETISLTGRWASLDSLRYYLTNGRAWLLQMPISDEKQAIIRQLSTSFNLVVDKLVPTSRARSALDANAGVRGGPQLGRLQKPPRGRIVPWE